MEKEEARKKMRAWRASIPFEKKQEWNRLAREALLSSEIYQKHQWIFPFVSCGFEIDTLELLQHCLEDGFHRVAVPRVEGKDMSFYEIHHCDELELSSMNILEPVTNHKVIARDGLMLLPGLAFDRQGHRVGYGAGYYDRYLTGHDCTKLHKMAYAYQGQIVDRIETMEFDYPVDTIMTECGIQWCSKK